MEFHRPVEELVFERSSSRSFRGESLGTNDLASIQRELDDVVAAGGVFGGRMRFQLLAAAAGDSRALQGLHTYGFIKNPAAFIVGAMPPSDHDLEQYGHALEMLVLGAIELGVGSCWLGGTFNRSRFAERVELDSSEAMPAVVALGYPTSSRGTIERVIRWGAGAKKRKPWSSRFFDGSMGRPLAEDDARWWHRPLEMVRAAPSASNKQPVRVLRHGEEFHFLLARTDGYARNMRVLGLADLQRVDVGISMCHFELGANAAGVPGRWALTDADLGPLPAGVEYSCTWTPTL